MNLTDNKLASNYYEKRGSSWKSEKVFGENTFSFTLLQASNVQKRKVYVYIFSYK